jgi:hypothetical protein
MSSLHHLQALSGDLSLEARRRAETILREIKQAKALPAVVVPEVPVPTGELLRALRAFEILEQIATPEAEALLNKFAEKNEDSQLTEQARASRDRLKSARAKR